MLTSKKLTSDDDDGAPWISSHGGERGLENDHLVVARNLAWTALVICYDVTHVKTRLAPISLNLASEIYYIARRNRILTNEKLSFDTSSLPLSHEREMSSWSHSVHSVLVVEVGGSPWFCEIHVQEKSIEIANLRFGALSLTESCRGLNYTQDHSFRFFQKPIFRQIFASEVGIWQNCIKPT